MRFGRVNGRLWALICGAVALLMIVALGMGAAMMGRYGIAPDLGARNLAPSLAHPFGTDAMGRDLLARSLHGLSLSLQIGLLAAGLSTAIATLVALASGFGRVADAVARFVTDAFLAMPHLLLLILLCFAMGGGAQAVVIAVAISHWPRLARILRFELCHLLQSPYVEAAKSFGRSRREIMLRHILPHLLPQMLVGFLLMFPHAILHEAALSFLGFGLEPSRPAIGVMLSDAMRHILAGRWWLAAFPGAMLLVLVLAFEALGSSLRKLFSPREARC